MKRVLALAVLAASVAHANPSGKKWFNLPVNYRIAASVDNTGGTNVRGLSGPTGGPAYATVVGRTQAAFQNWTQSKVTTCPGATSWNSNYTGTFASPTGGAALSSSDNFNSVIWLSGSAFQWGSSTLGITFTQYFPATGELDEADMAMNNNDPWSDLCAGAFQAFDYESVILHEAGHFLGLDHTPSVGAAVMFPSVSNGDCKRALQSNDISDVCTVYPPGTGSQGSSCTSTANCSGGRVCRSAAGSTAGICTVNCPATCPTGFSCQNATGSPAQACFPTVGSSDLCKFCSSGAACSTGQCVTDGAGHFFCSLACTTAAQCGPGFNCINTTAGGLCAPTGSCTNQCVGTGQSTCPTGYSCVNGLCDPTGNTGDHCELSEFCKPCNVCIGTSTEAYCRVCCGGADSCNNCPNGACTSGNACLQLNGETGKVCIPQAGAMLCQSCNATTPCLNGLACLAGACHNSCNPQSPGACGACLDQGGTNGTCACPSEVATVGGICGVQANGSFFACQNGLVCSMGTCRTACQISNPNSCPNGTACTTVSGKDVCLPSSAGLRCAACATSGNPCAAGLTCQAGRCYEPCNVNSATTCGGATSDCVQQMAAGDGICACANEKVGNNQACSAIQPIKSCNTGLKCIDGYCRSECVLNQVPTTCAGGLECRTYAGAGNLPFCQVVIPGTGGGGGTTCVANSQACTMASQCCSGNCVSGPTTTICAPMGGAGGGSGGSSGTGGGSSGTGGGTGTGGGSGTGGSGCTSNGVGCTTSANCCSNNCGAGPGGTMVCQAPQGSGGGNGSGTGGGTSSAGGGEGGSNGTGGSGTNTPPGGCGCNTGFGGLMVWNLFAGLAMVMWKRRGARSR